MFYRTVHRENVYRLPIGEMTRPTKNLAHLAGIPVVNPFAEKAAGPASRASVPTEDELLNGLWSTDPGDEPDVVASEATDLSDLWMDRVARETGEMLPSSVDLESIWMNEIASETGSTVANTSDEITFDDFDMDAELAQHRGAPTAGRFRVDQPPPRIQVGQAGRFAVMAEAREVTTRREVAPARQTGVGSLSEFRATRAARQATPAPKRSTMADLAEYASRPTSYHHLVNDD